MPCPMKPHTIPAKLYSQNFTPKHVSLLPKVYFLTPGMLASKTAEGTLESNLCRAANGQSRAKKNSLGVKICLSRSAISKQ